MARHAGMEIAAEDWMRYGHDVPLLVNMQPAGKYLGERFHRAGGVPAVLCELLRAGKIDGSVLTVTGKKMSENLEGRESHDREMIALYEKPLQERSGFLVMRGNLFDFAIMKTSVISDDFRRRYLSEKDKHSVFEGRAVVFDGADDYHARINDPALEIDERCILVMRGAGPIGWPGSAEVVNMQPPDALLKKGIMSLPTLGDGRQSGTSDSPSILNASPESAIGGGLAWLKTGDTIRIDIEAGRCDALVSEEEIARRKKKRRRLSPPARRHGRNCSAPPPPSSIRARSWNLLSNTEASPPRRRDIIIDSGSQGLARGKRCQYCQNAARIRIKQRLQNVSATSTVTPPRAIGRQA